MTAFVNKGQSLHHIDGLSGHRTAARPTRLPTWLYRSTEISTWVGPACTRKSVCSKASSEGQGTVAALALEFAQFSPPQHNAGGGSFAMQRCERWARAQRLPLRCSAPVSAPRAGGSSSGIPLWTAFSYGWACAVKIGTMPTCRKAASGTRSAWAARVAGTGCCRSASSCA